jgi:hypothetical protein
MRHHIKHKIALFSCWVCRKIKQNGNFLSAGDEDDDDPGGFLFYGEIFHMNFLPE